MDARKLIPSMFHRRLALLSAASVLLLLLFTGQLFRVSVVHGQTHREEAEARLRRETFLEVPRAAILDRRGRILARDVAGYDIAVDYEAINGDWARTQSWKKAAKEVGSTRWFEMSPEERRQASQERLPQFERQVEQLWADISRIGGVSRAQIDERLDEIKRRVQEQAERVWSRRQGITEAGGENSDAKVRQPIAEQKRPHVILSRVSDDIAFEFRRLERDYPELVSVKDTTAREYPWLAQSVMLDRSTMPGPLRSDEPAAIVVEGVADHVLGSMREVWADDLARLPLRTKGKVNLKGYRLGDVAGARGLELAFEEPLRGERGVLIDRLDAGTQDKLDPQPAPPLQTSLDIVVQAKVQALMDPRTGLARVQSWHENFDLPTGTPLRGAAVVIHVETGEIVAMASMPTLAMVRASDESVRDDPGSWVHRAAEAIYPPGSIVKPIVLAGAVSQGAHSLARPIDCTGHFFENKKDAARCWIYREEYGYTTHNARIGGPLDAVAALSRSCNIYFYTLADRMGMEPLVEWYAKFGLGKPLDVGLLAEVPAADGALKRVGEHGGLLPSPAKLAAIKAGEKRFATISMGIGQGEIAWTPLQAANAYAQLARGGEVLDATLVPHDPRPHRSRQDRADVPLSKELVRAALEGLRQSVEESWGTGYHIKALGEPIINVKGVSVCAKTGTAEAPPQLVDKDSDGKPETKLDTLLHSWFVGLVGPKGERPQYSIAVIVENGGSGGRTAGPIANQIIHVLQQEGYLPSGGDA